MTHVSVRIIIGGTAYESIPPEVEEKLSEKLSKEIEYSIDIEDAVTA